MAARTKGLALAALAGVYMCSVPALAVTVGDGIGAVGIKRYNGTGQLSAESVLGKVTVVNFWATWCEACKVELVEMEALLKPHFTDKDLQVAFVSLDKDPGKAAEWFKGAFNEPSAFLERLYVDPEFKAADELTVDSFPMTLVIGKDGKVQHVQRGFKEGAGSTEEIVKVALGLTK